MPKKNQKKQSVPETSTTETAAQSVSSQPAEPVKVLPKPVTLVPAGREPGWVLPVVILTFLLAALFSTESVVKPVMIAAIAVTVVLCLIRASRVLERFTWPVAGVVLWVLINGISMFYGITGVFALREFLKIMIGFCAFWVILAWSGEGIRRGRMAASAVTGGIAFCSLISIDMLSTRLLSNVLQGLLGVFSNDYSYAFQSPLEAGVRMVSLFENPNVYGGVSGLAVLLGLELAVTAGDKQERRFHLVCLFWNALAFLLVFSMGASATLAVAFVVLLLLERMERKGSLLLLMVETFLLVLAATVPIYLTAFDGWKGFQPVPLLCAVGGGALLCVLDQTVGKTLASRLEGLGKRVLAVILCVLVLLGGLAALAVNLTGPARLSAGEGLRRAGYPKGGDYTLEVEATAPLSVTIESQNQAETMMHTSTTLYSGEAPGARFTVPEDSKVVYFNFSAPTDLTLTAVTYTGTNGSAGLKLNYTLLPGFIANRLQGLFANENAIQRAVFFEDGIKLFRESPVVGQGLGAFESAYRHVQTFYYVTRYVHNHYIETLVSTGIVGLVLFVGMLALCAWAIWKNLRGGNPDPMAPCLGAALVFMATHGGVEVVFSNSHYLLTALCVLGLICVCCGQELPLMPEGETVRKGLAGAVAVLMLVFGITLYCNMTAEKLVRTNSAESIYHRLETAATIDLYEWVNYKLSYVYGAKDLDKEQNWEIYTKANEYAEQLSHRTSNIIPLYLAEFYFATDQQEKAFAMLEKHVNYMASDSEEWQNVFNLMFQYSQHTPEFEAEVAKLYQQFQDWNDKNMGTLTLTDLNKVYIESMMM